MKFKPRLKKLSGLWHCAIYYPHHILEHGVMGVGYTPTAAYEDWADQTLKFWRGE